MSDFNTLEISKEASRPLELYTFTLGAEIFQFTSAEDDITIGVDTWIAEAIGRDAITQGGDAARKNVIVTCPSDNVIPAKYVNIVPGQQIAVEIFRLQRDEVPTFDTQTLVFKGQIFDVKFSQNGHTADIVLRSDEEALARNIPRFTYMFSCNHILYSPDCGVDPDLFNVIGNITDETGNTITLTGATIEPDGFYTGGFCTPVGETDFRLILNHVGDVLTLLLPFASPVLNTDVQAFAGCDHLIDGDCATRFDNVIEYGGNAFVPKKNPFTTGLK